ncbi:MAG TPA: glycosyltransferase [Micromonosporaceae bacterium]
MLDRVDGTKIDGRRSVRTVLHVAQPTEGGVARYVADLARAQVAAGWQVVVAAPPVDPLRAAVLTAGARLLPWAARRAPGPGLVDEVRRLRAIVGRCDPALIHLHSSKAGLAGRLVPPGTRPVVFQPHAWSFEAAPAALRRLATGWERYAARRADVLLCVSEAERDRGLRAGIRGRYLVVPNGVDLHRYGVRDATDRAAARERLGLGPGALAVCVGRLCPQKGQAVLLDAWRSVTALLPTARLALVGDGPDATELRRRAGAGVLFAGAVDDPVDWYAAADVVVCPSRWEGMALVPLEAMACGRSVVATDVTGMRESVPPDAGALVPPGDVPALTGALVQRLRRVDVADAEGRAGRAHVRARHCLTRTVAAVDALYRRLLGAPSAVTVGDLTLSGSENWLVNRRSDRLRSQGGS